MTITERNIRENPSILDINAEKKGKGVLRDLQSIEHKPPTKPIVLLYPTRKLSGFRVAGEAK